MLSEKAFEGLKQRYISKLAEAEESEEEAIDLQEYSYSDYLMERWESEC